MRASQNGLIPESESQRMLYEMFTQNLQEGQLVHVLFEACGECCSEKQKRLLRLNIRKISESTGQSYNEVSDYLKKECGLEYKKSGELTSEEVNLMYNEIRNLCNKLDIPSI